VTWLLAAVGRVGSRVAWVDVLAAVLGGVAPVVVRLLTLTRLVKPRLGLSRLVVTWLLVTRLVRALVMTGIARTRRLIRMAPRMLRCRRVPRVVGHRSLVTGPSTIGRNRVAARSSTGHDGETFLLDNYLARVD
jgi:hypothetical protein